MYTYDDYYEEEVINESALDMAMDMSDRYGVAVEDAYDFAVDALEGSLNDPHKRRLREQGRAEIAAKASNDAYGEYTSHDRKYSDWLYDNGHYGDYGKRKAVADRRKYYKDNAKNAENNFDHANDRLQKVTGLRYRPMAGRFDPVDKTKPIARSFK